MKLRETIDFRSTEEGGSVVAHPFGISRFPNYRLHGIMIYVVILLILVFGGYTLFGD